MSEGSDDNSASRRHRGATVDTTQSTGDLSKKIRKETLGIFNPDNPDDKDNQGLITTSSGKTIYIDVFMFCEHLSVFKRFGEYSLTDYYVGMLSGKASAWLMSKLDSPSHILNELHSSRYTPKVAARGITLAQWAQRKAGLAKQIGYTQDSTIIITLFNKIDIEIQRFLTYPSENTSLISFIRQSHDDAMTTIDRNEMTDTEATDYRGRIQTPGRAMINMASAVMTAIDVKEEKKVYWEWKYPVMEEEDELGPDKVDTDGDSESVCLSRSTSSEEAYLTYMTGNTSYLDGQKELFCGTC
ncbi:uncharacterized protein FFNC_12787 [Fusarium fujikuroi]|nr:uncharacterized protein FFNC_12787 [Fusarium fujikuroi]